MARKLVTRDKRTMRQRIGSLTLGRISSLLVLLAGCTVMMFWYLRQEGIPAMHVFTNWTADAALWETRLCLIALAGYVVICVIYLNDRRKRSI